MLDLMNKPKLGTIRPTILGLPLSLLLIYLYFSDYFFTINIYDTYYLINYSYIVLSIIILVGFLFLLKKVLRKKNL
jgi:hypothetical protein